jgi:hypothetical protein
MEAWIADLQTNRVRWVCSVIYLMIRSDPKHWLIINEKNHNTEEEDVEAKPNMVVSSPEVAGRRLLCSGEKKLLA